MRRYLVIANQTLAEAELTDAIRQRLEAGPSSVYVLVPNTSARDLVARVTRGAPIPTAGGSLTVDDETGLARPVAFVVSSTSVTEDELAKWVLARLEPYKHPRKVYFVDQLPQTHLGKVDRGALKRTAI